MHYQFQQKDYLKQEILSFDLNRFSYNKYGKAFANNSDFPYRPVPAFWL